MAGNKNSGRKKKPIELKIAQGTHRNDRDGHVVVDSKLRLESLPDPPTHLVIDFDELAQKWYYFMGLNAVKYGTIDMVDIAQLAVCAQLHSKTHRYAKEADVQMERMLKVQKEYQDTKDNMVWDGDLKIMDQLLKEETGARQLYKMMRQQESDCRRQATSISAAFGFTPADRLKFAEQIANAQDEEETSSKDVKGDEVGDIEQLL